MTEPKIFYNKLSQLNNNFYLNIEGFIPDYINNFIEFNKSGSNNSSYTRIISNLSENNGELFDFVNQLDKASFQLTNSVNEKNIILDKLKKLNHKYKFMLSNTNSSIGAAKLLNEEKQFQYNLNNIEIFNYLIGIILGSYIISNIYNL